MVGYQKKEVALVGLTMFLIPAALALAVWGGVMAVEGIQQRNKDRKSVV